MTVKSVNKSLTHLVLLNKLFDTITGDCQQVRIPAAGFITESQTEW